MPIPQRKVLQQGNYGTQFNRGVDVAKSQTPARSVGTLTKHTQFGVIRKVSMPPGLPTFEVKVCDEDTGELKTYIVYGFEKPHPPSITGDSTKVTGDSTVITGDHT